MAKRMVTSFSRAAFPTYEEIDEDGQAKPCVYGVTAPRREAMECLSPQFPLRRDRSELSAAA